MKAVSALAVCPSLPQVPVKVSYEAFWHHYFYQVHLLEEVSVPVCVCIGSCDMPSIRRRPIEQQSWLELALRED